MKNFNFLEKLWEHGRTLRRVGLVLVMCLITIPQAWAYWYVPGNINGKNYTSAGSNQMNGSNQITFYAVQPGDYWVKLNDGQDGAGHWYNGDWDAYSQDDEVLDIGYDNGNITLHLTQERDIFMEWKSGNKLYITTYDPSYHIKYNWSGGGWAWSNAMTNNGDGTYSCIGRYNDDLINASTGWRYRKYSSGDDSDGSSEWHAGFASGSVKGSPSGGDYCVYTYNPSENTLEIRKCNSIAATSHIYFDNTTTSWSNTYKYLIIGRPTYRDNTSPYIGTYGMSVVDHTKLWYYEYTSSTFSDADYYAVAGRSDEYNSANIGRYVVSNGTFDNYTGQYAACYNMSNTVNYIITPSSSSNGASISIADWNTYASAMNSTQTIKYSVSWDGNNTYSELTSGVTGKNTPAQIQISAYKFVDGTYNSVTNSSNLQTISANQNSTVSKSVPAAYTGATTLTYSSVGTHFDWIGWYDAANGGSVVSSPYYPKTAGTVYARLRAKKYTVTYNANGGTCGTSSAQATAFTSVTLPTPTWSGYSFDGWYSNGEKIGNAGDSYTPTADITLYAKWTDNTAGKIFSYIDGNYGDKWKAFDASDWATSNQSSKSYTFTHATTKIQYRIINAEWENKSNIINNFAKWKNGTTTMSVVIPTDTIAQVKILYGAYDKKNILTINSTNTTAVDNALENGLTSAQVASKLKEVTLSNKEGTLTFGAAAGNIYIARVVATITGYKIHYDKGANGTGTISAGTKTHGSNFTLSSSTFSRDGYTQTGWSTTDGGTKAYNMGDTYSTDAAITLYPYWTPTSYTLSYDLDGGNVASDNPTSYTIESSAITLNNPTKTGYTFAGWTGTGLAEATTTVTIAAGSTGNRSYTATWTANQYSVTHSLTNMSTTSGSTGSNAATYGTTYSAVLAAADGYTLPATITVTAGLTDITDNCTWNSSTGAVSIPGSYITGNITITAAGEEDEEDCGITLTQFGKQYRTSSPRRDYAYTSNKFDERFIIETDDSNCKGVSNNKTDSLYLYLNYGHKFSVHASDVLKDSIFEDVTKIKLKYRSIKSGSYTLTFDVYVGGTKVGSVSKAVTDQTWNTETINVSPAKDGRVTIKNTGSGSTNYDLHFDSINICGTLPDPCTEITPTWSTDYTSTALNVGATSSTPAVGKDGSSGAVTFSSSDGAIATVNSSGVVTAVKSGSVTITATVAADDENNKCEGKVTKNFTIKAGVTYNGNSPTSGSAPTDANYYAANEDITIAGKGSLVKDGKVFNGWNTKADGTGTHYEVGATMKMPNKSAGVILYAEWVGYATSWDWKESGASDGGTSFTYLTDKNYVLSFTTDGDNKATWDIGGGIYYRGVKLKTKDDNMSFWVQSGKEVSITFGTRPTKPTFTVGGVDKSSEVGASTNADSITVTYTTSADTKFYIENETSTGTAFTIKRVKIENAGVKHNVTFALTNVVYSSGDNEGTNAATEGSDFSVVFAPASRYTLPDDITVEIGGATATVDDDYTWDPSTGELVIVGASITGNIVVTIEGDEGPIPALITYNLQAPNKSTTPLSLDTTSVTTIPATLKGDTLKNFSNMVLGSSFSITGPGKGDSGGTWTAKIGKTPADSTTTDANSVKLSFDVHDDYELSVTSVSLRVKAVSSGTRIFRACLSDGTSSVYGRVAPDEDKDDPVVFGSFSGVKFSGKVTLTLWVWGSSNKEFRIKTPIQIDGSLTKKPEPEGFTISFAGNGNTSGSTANHTAITSGDDVSQLNANGFVKTGHSFAGWKTNTALTYVAYGDADEEGNRVAVAVNGIVPDKAKIKNVTSDITLTAQWTPNTYDITYNLNGASWAGGYSAPANYTVGTGATLPVAGDMTNTGYSFNGWKNNSGLTGDNITAIGTSEYGNKEFWAKWTENTYTVTYSANGGTGDAMSNTVGHYVTLSTNTYTKSDYIFAGWNTATDGSGASYSEGEEIELKANLDLYAIWATDYTITWEASPKLSGVAAKPNLGGGNYTITASVATWTGSLTTSMISAETSGVTITSVSVDNDDSPKTITATFNVGASVVGDKISFTLDVPANGSYSAKSDTEDFDIDRCTGSGSGSDGVLFSAEFKDTGLGASDICTAANTPYTFTTAELKAAPTGGSIKAFSTSNLSHMKYATNAISIAGSDGVIQIDLTNAVATNDLFTYVNVNSNTSAAYLRHTTADNTTDQIALTGYNSQEKKVMLPAGYNGKTTLYIVRNNKDFKLHKAAVVRPAFLMLLSDDTPTSDTNLEGTDQELTTENYLAVISGGSATFTSPSSGNLKIKRSNSKNYINFNNAAGYVKIELNDALQEGDVIGFDSYNTNELALTITATRSTTIRTTSQLYTVGSSSALKDQTTFYLWQNSGSSDFLRGLQIARSGVAGGGGGTDKITTTLTWDTDLSGGVAAETGDADFTHTVTQDKNSLGAITYSSSNTSVATVNASGKVHIVGAGNATITATMAASGCYKEATVSYNITVTDNCDDTPGTIIARDLECEGTELTVSGHTTTASTSYLWYKDGELQDSYTAAKCTVTVAGEYYVVVDNTAAGDGHCAKASTNTITLEGNEAATASNIVNSWYVKNGRRTPDIALVQTENATNFTVTSGGSPITTFAGCAFYLGTDGIIYLKGQQEDGSAPTGLTSGDETLKFIATACGGNSSELSITIHKQESTTRPSVAFVVDGTKEGDFDEEEENHSVNTALYQYLDYGADMTGAFDLTGQNVYSTVDEQAIREHYSQFDAILITDDPSTDTKIGKKSCVDAFGTMIDVRPMLTMEAFVSKWGNWKAKGIDGNPESPNPRQYKMKLQCKDHAIFKDLSVGTNVETETIDGVEYWTVTMVDSTKSPYSGVADGTDTDTKPALQGFSADDVSSLLLLGEISGGSLYAGVERQEETAARLMLLGLNAKALPNALTPEGKKVIENALKYLIETDLEKVDDCSNYFTGETSTDWNTDSNWSKKHVPNSPNVRVRILSECVINSGTYKVAEVNIATSGKSLHKAGEMTGKLTINAGAALIVGGKIRTAEAPYFNTGDLKPTEKENLVIETNGSNQGALILNNDAGDTKATVNLYSLGRKEGGSYQFQYMAVPMNYVNVSESFAGSDIYTYVWLESAGWERRGYYTELYAFEGVGITTKIAESSHAYTMRGNLASTATQKITLTNSTKGGLNLIGNSWTAPIQIGSLAEDNTDANITKTVYIYCTGNDGGSAHSGETETAGQWLAVPFEAAEFADWKDAGKLSVIPAMQAFEIKVTEEATLTLDYNKLVRGSTNDLNAKLRAPHRNEVAETTLSLIRVSDSKTHTDLSLFESERFSEAFDNGWEAELKEGNGWSATLYAETETGHMAVVAMEDYEGTIVGFKPGTESEYTYSFIGADSGYYLNDLKTHRSVRISEGETYTFTTEEGDAVSRFYISRTAIDAQEIATGVTDLDAEAPKVQKVIYNDKLYIIRGGKVYSAEGQLVK